jgi:peroxiredoxin
MKEGDTLPDVRLPSTTGELVSLRREGVTVFYVFPKSGRPGVELPVDWGEPGMKGCTAQSCSFRDLHGEILSFGAEIFGISTLDTHQQFDFLDSNALPYQLLSDPDAVLEGELRLPTVALNDEVRVYKRLTFITHDGKVEKVFFPVLTPEENAAEVLVWLRANRMKL